MNRIRKPQHDGLNAQQRVAVLVIGADQSAGPEIASLLAELGYDVPAVATSGAEALHVAATERIDLALLDLQLGGSMSATDTALQMRRQFGIPVIFLSDHGDGAALRTAQTADPYGFIFKPCGKDEVRVAVGLALARTTNDHSLRESEDRFHAMYDFAPDAYFMYDAHGILLDVNRSGENLIGYAKEELIGRSILTNGLLSPEDVPRASDLIGSSKERVLLGPDEFTLIAKDGRRVHTEIRGYPITLNGRRVLLAIARDLTDRRKTEEALRESERRMKVHVESSPIAAIEWDSDLKVTRWNPAAEKIFGYAREDALGRHISFLFAGKVDEATLRPWRQLLTDDAAQQVSTENVTGEGLMISCDWLNTPLVASTGKTTGVVSLVQDVSAKRKAESDIRILSRAVEQSDEVMFITDPSGAITYANAAFEKVYAYRRSDIIGKTPRILKNAEFSPIDYTQLWSTISAGKSFSGQLVNKRRDGSPVVVNASITPLIDDRGDCTGYLAVQSDVTAKCKADDELKRSYSLLHATLQSTADGILVVDGKGQITGFNERFAHLWRIPKHILESHDDGRAMQFVLDQLIDPQAFVAKVQELYARPDQESFDILEFKDGRLFERYSQPQRLDGKAVGRVWSFRDISERNRAERELATERNLLRTLIDSIPDRIYVKDKECKFLVNNRAHLAALGAHSMDQTVGKTDFDFRPEQQAEPYFHDDLKVIHSGQSLYDREEETILPSGEHGWLLTTKVPVRDPGGDILGIVGISRDISSRKRMEEALREGEREFRSLFNNAVLGIYRTTPDGKILAANPAFCRMLGYGSVADMKQLNLEKNGLEEKEARDRFKREMETHGFVRGYESRLRKADGTFISTRENAVVVKNEKGEILYYEGTIEDMTEARLAQEKVARLAHALTSISETVNITDLDGNFLFVNEAFLRAYGYTEDEILGQSVDTIRSPRNPADLSGRILQNTREGGWHGELITSGRMAPSFPCFSPHRRCAIRMANRSLSSVSAPTSVNGKRLRRRSRDITRSFSPQN
jgi:PAS domain S-box-containing protein